MAMDLRQASAEHCLLLTSSPSVIGSPTPFGQECSVGRGDDLRMPEKVKLHWEQGLGAGARKGGCSEEARLQAIVEVERRFSFW
ncbi:uncharacterized protein ARMOST_12361 [Armillaria ostoyae]|uniref:Uncharacterized protein n=1 Tax=Armillaria ostoyae TaxID=47428 RepID=A0A284RJR3_ARMOS|nr:uncharacterized protein ARMOST_12361 [Armillaria ostoyae]